MFAEEAGLQEEDGLQKEMVRRRWFVEEDG
jgi:hypothetical protein